MIVTIIIFSEPDVILEGAGLMIVTVIIFSEPDVILEGAGFRIGYGRSNYRGSKNATIKLVFLEHDWYFFPGQLTHNKLRW